MDRWAESRKSSRKIVCTRCDICTPLPLYLILEVGVSISARLSAERTSEYGTNGGSLPRAAEAWIQFSVALGKLIGQELGKQKSVHPQVKESAVVDSE